MSIDGEGLGSQEKKCRQLWRNVTRLSLVTQQRAIGCNVQMERLSLLREQRCFTREMYNGIKPLNVQTVVDDPGWHEHTSLHATNEARLAAGIVHLRRYADRSGKFLYRWRCPLPPAFVNLPQESVDAFYNKTPEAWQYYARGAPFMVLLNLNVAMGVTNGSIGKAHAIHFAPEDMDEIKRLEDEALESNTNTITLPTGVTPKYIELAFKRPNNVAGAAPGTIDGNKWILPFRERNLDPINVGTQKVSLRGFKITQAFSLTFHKCQGLTMRKVALDLSKKQGRGGTNMIWEMLYVGISRAPSDGDLRIIPPCPGKTVDYLFGMKARKITTDYLDEAKWDLTSGLRGFGVRRPREEEPRVEIQVAEAGQQPTRGRGRGRAQVPGNRGRGLGDQQAQQPPPQQEQHPVARGRGRGGRDVRTVRGRGVVAHTGPLDRDALIRAFMRQPPQALATNQTHNQTQAT
jgi:hypothetical protein